MDPRDAARVLENALRPAGRDFTIADAAAKSGLALRDAERGLHALVEEYRGRLRITNDGDVLFHFPTGFTKPWVVTSKIGNAFRRAGRAIAGVGRFVLRAWITIMLVGYVLAFLVLIIGFLVASSSRDSSDDGRGAGLAALEGLLRIIAEALFWTFHPWSPFAVNQGGWRKPTSLRSRDANKVPFYERVNRFVFGPREPPVDERDVEKKILAEIRGQRGRIGLADVVRVTGLSREEADPLMSRLMLDYDGDVLVSDEGGITYEFKELRKTVDGAAPEPRPWPIWSNRKQVLPVTGNPGGSNFLISMLNGVNLAASTWAIAAGLTISNIVQLFTGTAIGDLPNAGIPVVFGLIPLIFSLIIFAMPIGRRIGHASKKKAVARENGRRAMLRVVLDDAEKGLVSDEKIRVAWKEAAGEEAEPTEISREVAELGGTVDMEASGDAGGTAMYRFEEFHSERAALKKQRAQATEAEAKPAAIVFDTHAPIPDDDADGAGSDAASVPAARRN